MLDQLLDETVLTCDEPECDRSLGEPAIVFETGAGCRMAYECSCGAVTVTVVRPESRC